MIFLYFFYLSEMEVLVAAGVATVVGVGASYLAGRIGSRTLPARLAKIVFTIAGTGLAVLGFAVLLIKLLALFIGSGR